MKEFIKTEVKAETAILVGLITRTQDERKTAEYLDELEFLAETAGAVTVKRFTQRLDSPSSVTYVGKGKLEEIRCYIEAEEEAEREIGMVIFDDELSAKQLRNIEKELKVKILDRTSLILDIFAMRAQTANAKTQVELAQYRYMLPRLQRLWTHLERQGGGSGSGGGKGSVGLRGPGETQLEMDRRIILNRMALLKQRLADIDRQKTTQRKNRGRMIRVALVGYTNVGKSTLINLLAKTEVFAENKLFATLDTTVRKVIIDNLPFLPADTVGFIRKLPTDLVDSFKSTLDEVREADWRYTSSMCRIPTLKSRFKWSTKHSAIWVAPKNRASWCSTKWMPTNGRKRTPTTSLRPPAKMCRSTNCNTHGWPDSATTASLFPHANA